MTKEKPIRVLFGNESGRILVDKDYLEIENGLYKVSSNAEDVTADAIFAVAKFLEQGKGKFEFEEDGKIYQLKLKTKKSFRKRND